MEKDKNKDAFIGLRVTAELKQKLEVYAEQEARSLSQMCELLLLGGLQSYEKDGSRYMQQLARLRLKRQ